MKQKIVLAFSGGLDTSFCVKYLTKELSYEVHTITVNTGGFDKNELRAIAQQAKILGVRSHVNIEATKNYYDEVIKFLIFGNILKNNTYPLSVSAERMSQAKAVALYVKKIKADAVAHGSTGAGNDQVRFDMIFNILIPNIKIVTPIRDLKLSREKEISYLQECGIEMNVDKANYSINKGLWGTSIGGKETLKSLGALPESAFTRSVTQSVPKKITIFFNQGEPLQINDKKFIHPSDAILYLEEEVNGYGIGRDIHVGDTIIGIKGRVGFEAAAPILIIKAHHLLEKHNLTKWQLVIKEQLAQFYGSWLHEGQYLDPVMRDIENFFTNSQKNITGRVTVIVKPYHFELVGIESEFDLMSSKFGKYGEQNNAWSGEDVKGFSKIFGNQTMIYTQINNPQK